MGQQFLIDSNVIIDYLAGKLPKEGMLFVSTIVNEIPNVSVVSKIEVLGYNTDSETTKILDNFFSDIILLELNNEIVDQTIQLKRTLKIKTPDAIIAATAIVYQLTLVTRNLDDFNKIPGLDIINPWDNFAEEDNKTQF